MKRDIYEKKIAFSYTKMMKIFLCLSVSVFVGSKKVPKQDHIVAIKLFGGVFTHVLRTKKQLGLNSHLNALPFLVLSGMTRGRRFGVQDKTVFRHFTDYILQKIVLGGTFMRHLLTLFNGICTFFVSTLHKKWSTKIYFPKNLSLSFNFLLISCNFSFFGCICLLSRVTTQKAHLLPISLLTRANT